MRKGIIYKAINKTNGKIYIGKTIYSLGKRISKHYSASKHYEHKFARALRKYNKDSWEWKIHHPDIIEKHLNEMEIFYIFLFDTYESGYNSTKGGDGGFITKFSKGHREKISNALKGKKKSKEHIQKVAATKIKTYEIIKPNGDVEVIKNLSQYCRENNLHDSHMCSVALGKRKHHKGYKCKKIGEI